MPGEDSDRPTGHLSRRTMLQGSAFAALAASMPAAATAGQATPAAGGDIDIDAVDRFAAEALAEYGVPGAAVAVVHRGETILAKGYGVRSIEGDDPVDADTVFQLASNTKPMTAFTYGTLVDEGLAEWTTAASALLTDLRLMDEYATLHANPRDFLSHRAGFPEFFGDLLGDIGYDRAEVVRRLRYVQPGHEFRDVAAYSNLGFFLVGEMITQLTGAPWEEAMQARLFEPLGMTRSGPSIESRPADGNMSANHATVDGSLVTVAVDDHGVTGAAGSAISTASDMARWMSMLLANGAVDGQQVIAADTVRTLFDPVIAAPVTFTEAPPISPTNGFAYSLGWGVFHWHDARVLEKGGARAGLRTVVNLVPELELGVAVLANLNLTYLPEAIRAFVLEQALGPADTDMQAEIRVMAQEIEAVFAAPPPTSAGLPMGADLDAYAGTYQQDLYGEFMIIVDGDNLRLEAGPDRRPAELRFDSLNTFLLDWGSPTEIPEPLTFTLGPDGTAVSFATESLGQFDRVEGD
jgi:CubicO group peptidase (beta-lactamase class C family)